MDNTEIEKYIRCRYCSELYNYNNDHKCIDNYKEDKIIYCYRCGEKNKEYSNTQLLKKEKARCKTCILYGEKTRYAPYSYLYEGKHDDVLDLMHINKKLIYYITNLDLQKVNELLKDDNINPNYMRQDNFFDTKEHRWACWYNKDGSEKPETNPLNPITPLKLCVFILSNGLFSKAEKLIIVEIAKSLINAGAIVDDSIDYFIDRYKEKPYHDDVFDSFYELLVQNKNK